MAERQSNRQFRLPRRMRLSRSRDFRAVFDARVRKEVGPLRICARPNDLGIPRLGMSIPRSVGGAVRRNRIKRLIREAFRLMQHDWPRGYDVVVVVRPHEPFQLADYQKALFAAMRSLHQIWMEKTDERSDSSRGD